MQAQYMQRASSSRPKDRSLEAYKTWMIEIARRLTTRGSELQLTEAEWIVYWKEFWRETSRSQ